MSKIKDRLPELLKERKKYESSINKNVMETKKEHEETPNTDMERLQELVRAVEAKLARLKRTVSEMETLQRTLMSSPFPDKQIEHKYHQIVNHIPQVSGEARGKLRVLEDHDVQDVTGDSALAKIKKEQLNRLTNNLVTLNSQFYKAKWDYPDKLKNRRRAQLEVTKRTSQHSEEEINEILQKDNYSTFTQNFISDVRDAESELREIEDRHEDILALEKGVFELNELFKDMHVFVHDQGVTIDSILGNVTTTTTYIEEVKDQFKVTKEKVLYSRCDSSGR